MNARNTRRILVLIVAIGSVAGLADESAWAQVSHDMVVAESSAVEAKGANASPVAPQSNPTGPQSADSSATPDSDAASLQQIVVTATRRAESLQNVPISVAAFSRDDLEALRIEGINDLTHVTPGIGAVYNGSGDQTIISIRGIASVTGQSTTGIYLDDTPIQIRYMGAGETGAQAFPSVFDLDRVEVLRGPQGTLFGAGSEGGTLRFITPDPSFTEFSGHARSEFAFNMMGAPSYQFGSAFGGPLVTDDLAFRVSAYVQEDGGWIDQKPYPGPFISQQNENSATTFALDGALAWAVTENLTVTPKVFYQYQRTGAPDFYWPGASNTAGDRFVDLSVVSRTSLGEFALPSLKIEWALGNASLFSNTSYLNRTHAYTSDYTLSDNVAFTGNYTGPIAPAPGYNENPQHQFTQELRLQSNDSGSPITWVVGAFYQSLSEGAVQPVTSPTFANWAQVLFGKTVTQLLGVPLLEPGDYIYLGVDSTRDTQLAEFGQVDVKIANQLTLTAGVRYGTYKFEYSNYQNGPYNGGPTGSSGNGSQSQVTPKVGVNYKPFDNLMVYASATKGFRPGGPNSPVPDSCAGDLHKLGYAEEPTSYNPDSLWSYEVGAKGELSRILTWDASVFYIDWKKPQTEFLLPDCGGYSLLINAGHAVSKGFDLQGRFAATDRLTLQGSVGYDDARYAQTLASPGSLNVVTSGELLPTPPWHAMIAIDYVFSQLAGDKRPYAHLDDSYSSNYSLSSTDDALFDPNTINEREAVNIATARVGLRSGSWDVSLFSSNIFNAHPIVGSFHIGGATSQWLEAQTIPPRTIGVTGTYKF